MSKTFEVEAIVPEGLSAGDTFILQVEVPAPVKTRGLLTGLTLTEMSDEQIKRELINASSVLYKATKRGAPAETIAQNQARVEAVKAVKEERGLGHKAAKPEVEVETDANVVYNEDTALEI